MQGTEWQTSVCKYGIHSPSDRDALEAIQELHKQLDDDENGNVDWEESDEFLREELSYTEDYHKRHENFHKNNDDQVTEDELWIKWVNSPVRHWTIEETASWIGDTVQLPQYQNLFKRRRINGSYLARLAVNHGNILSHLGIKGSIDRQMIKTKAQDAVLFGPPKNTNSSTKDGILIGLLVAFVPALYWIWSGQKALARDREKLIQRETLLKELQQELEESRNDQRSAHKTELLADAKVSKLQHEVKKLRTRLHRAENNLSSKTWKPPSELEYLLQETYKVEMREHERKQRIAEVLLKKAFQACEKLKKKRSKYLNAFMPFQSKRYADVDAALDNAHRSLIEIQQEEQNRKSRWTRIETLLSDEPTPMISKPVESCDELSVSTDEIEASSPPVKIIGVVAPERKLLEMKKNKRTSNLLSKKARRNKYRDRSQESGSRELGKSKAS